MRVAVIGGAGFVAGELLRLLHLHPDVREIVAVSRSAAGRRLQDVHPALAGSEAVFSNAEPAQAARGADAVFLALEPGAARRIAAEVLSAGPRVVCDLSPDFRIGNGRFVYALADIAGPELRGATALAAPGCFATAAQLALAPLARLRPIDAPSLFAITGSSGAGAALKGTTHHPLRAHNVFAYAPLSHRHEAEIAERWLAWAGGVDTPRLLVHAGPFVRGIYLTLHARLEQPADGAAAYRSYYARSRFVRVVEEPPQLTHVVGSNRADVFVATSEARDEIQVSIAIDNLIKGAAGQAIQAVNLSLALDEGAGLAAGGAFPC